MNEFTVEQMQEISESLKSIFQIDESDDVLLQAAEVIDNCIKMHHKSQDVLKPCPFDGTAPKFVKRINETRGIDVIDISWKIVCPICGCKKEGAVSKYRVTDDAQLKLVGPIEKRRDSEGKLVEVILDARKDVIEDWNKRACDCFNDEEKENDSES